jgi:ATP-binding protein involved in chromosome partitioning
MDQSPPEALALPVEDESLVRARIAERLARVERVLLVMSGKGGVGKSAVAVNLALALAARGGRVGILDADLNGPSVAKMLGLRGQPLRLDASGSLKPVAGPAGLAVQSMDFFLQGNQPLDWEGRGGEGATWRSAMEQAALCDLVGQTEWGDLDFLVVDLAPGADRLPALVRFLPPIAAALAVTIPTEVAWLAVDRSIRRAYDARVPIIGIVENFGTVVCSACGHAGALFREAGVERLARDLGLERIARIPFDPELAAAADSGRSFLEGPGRGSAAGDALVELAEVVSAFEIPAVGARTAVGAENGEDT